MELKNRIDFVYLLDVQDGNPNGDPDAGNLPRIDAETGMGLITDVCLKRKVRNYVQITRSRADGYDIFVREKVILNKLIEEAYDEANSKTNSNKNGKKETEDVTEVEESPEDKARKNMCRRYYDVRTFGAVMNTGGKKAGQVRGPVQLTFSRSVEPIIVSEHTITRIARTKEDEKKKEGVIGCKATIPYGLYVCHGFISANLAHQTGFCEADLDLFWEALKNMFECDHSAARGFMSARKIYVFKHDSLLGNASASSLLDRIKIERKDKSRPARSFSDYEISVDTKGLPESITLTELIDGVL